MNYTVVDLSSSLFATLAFSLLFLPPGYLFAHLTDLLDFRGRSAREQVLWSLSLSLPISMALSAVLGRYVPQVLLTSLFVIVAGCAVARVLPLTIRNGKAGARVLMDRRMIAAMVLLLAYVLLTTAGIQIGSRLYESVSYTDWSVRLPLVDAAIRNGVPPGNPFFTVHLQPQSSRYYYYWYSLCAQVGRPFHLSARACLSASSVWSGYSLLAVVLLSVKHLLRYTFESACKAMFPVLLCCVAGLDVLPTLIGYCLRTPVIYAEPEWWISDRIPSFLGAIVFAPHHIGGLVCCVLAFLVLSLSRYTNPGLHDSKSPLLIRWRAQALAVLTASLCFMACAGDSSYLALCAAVIGVIYSLDLLWQRRWVDFAVLCSAGIIAGLCSAPYLREVLFAPSLTLATSASQHHYLRVVLRSADDGGHFAAVIIRLTHDHLHHFVRTAMTMLLLPTQFGFLLVPLAMRAMSDIKRLRDGIALTDGERLLWATFVGALVPALFLSSAPTQGTNDLGRHAALILRFVGIVWATPLLWPYYEKLRCSKQLHPVHPVLARFAFLLCAVGLTTQAWQIISNRLMIPFLQYHPSLHPGVPLSPSSDIGERSFQLRRGLDLVEGHLPAKAVVQSNMGDPYQMLVMLYSSRAFSAGDVSCESAFGGDPRVCTPRVIQLQRLFGSSSDQGSFLRYPYHDVPLANPGDVTTVRNFEQTCRDQDLAAILVQNVDFAWTVPNSWVWKLTPLYAAPLVRIFGCPA